MARASYDSAAGIGAGGGMGDALVARIASAGVGGHPGLGVGGLGTAVGGQFAFGIFAGIAAAGYATLLTTGGTAALVVGGAVGVAAKATLSFNKPTVGGCCGCTAYASDVACAVATN